MINLRAISVCAALLVFLAAHAIAQEDGDKKKKRRGGDQITKNIMRQFAKADLSEEQTKKAKEIIAQHSEDMASLQKELGSLISKEQKQARRQAQKKAKQDGLKGKERNQAIWAAMKFSEEDIKKFQDVNKKTNQLRQKIAKEIYATLSDEQKEKVKLRGKRGSKKGKKKKKDGDG